MPDPNSATPPPLPSQNILIAGGTGDIGSRLAAHLRAARHHVTIITRTPSAAPHPAIGWNDPALPAVAARSEVIINLAGESIWSARWSAAKKREIRRSRLDVLQRLMPLAHQSPAPGLLLNASGIAWYGTIASRIIDDEAAAPGEGFLAHVCRDAEQFVDERASPALRVIHFRIGVTLSPGGVALRRLTRFQRFLCPSRLGSGTQGFSWIHVDDLAALFAFAISQPDWRGPCNAVAPNPVTFGELGALLSHRLRRPRCLRLPAPLLRLALGEAADVLLHGHKVFPFKALAAGFQFRFPTLEGALADLLG